MAGERSTLEHLFTCLDTTYRTLGELAPTLGRDAYVIQAYETARAIGEVALRFRAFLGAVPDEEVAPLADVLRQAAREDPSGVLVLFSVASLIGPRLLVSLRDAREFAGLEGEALELANEASGVLVAAIRAIGVVAGREAPLEDPSWLDHARELARTLEDTGNAESFGFAR